MSARTTVCLLLLTLIATGLHAQDVRGHLTGRVTDEDGMAIPSANVVVTSTALQGSLGTTTDAAGVYRFVGLPVGSYEVAVSHVARDSALFTAVPIRLGQTTDLGVVAMAASTARLEAVVVSSGRLAIDPTTTTVGGNFKASHFEALPTERDFRSIVNLLPQANTSYLGDGTNVAGATGLENVYYIDGINVTNPFNATTSTNLPYNFIEEIQLRQGGYEAEFGRSLGGIVNVVTYSGGNELTGKAFGYFTNAALTGAGKPGVLGVTAEEFTTYDVGLSLAGPILRDRLWFFAAVNASREVQDVEIPTLGLHEDRYRQRMFAGKLTWRVDDVTDIMLSIFGDPATHERISADGFWGTPTSLASADPFLNEDERGGTNLSLRATRRIGDDLLIEADAARYRASDNHHGATQKGDDEPLYIDYTDGSWSGGIGWQTDRSNERLSGSLRATLFRQGHTLKAGVGYEENRVDQRQLTPWPGWILRTGETSYETLYWFVDDEVESRIPTAFVQDEWQVAEHLRINAGLRWEGQFFVGAGDSVAQSITNQWQPRVGLVYTPDVTQKVSASFGRFYQQLPVYSAFGTYVGADNWSNYYDTDPRVNPDDYDSQRVYTTREPMHVRVDDLEGEHADELTFGYERILDGGYVVGARGIYRTLRQAYILGGEQGEVPGEVDIYYGNPGIGSLDFLPEAERTYTALELTAKRSAQRFRVSASYVLSRNRGNYTGQYSSDQRDATPGNNFSLQIPEHNDKTKGLLPNDRTHVFKLHGTYRATSSLQGGAFFTWQSGTPLSEFGQSEFGLSRPLFLVERGSAGRTPSLWDLNLRLTYDLPRLGRAQRQGRLILDVLHLGSPREGVATDQWRYWGRDPETGEQTNPNPNFGLATRHQPPMSARLGFELDF